MDVRAERLTQAIEGYKQGGGSVKQLSKLADVPEGNIYRARKTGKGMGRTMAGKLAPVLGVTEAFLLGLDVYTDSARPVDPDSILQRAEIRSLVAWWKKIPMKERPRVWAFGRALADEGKVSSEHTRQPRDTRRRRRGSQRTVPKREP